MRSILWTQGHADIQDLLREVHVWRIGISALEPQVSELWKELSMEERERAEKFHFRKDQVRFIIVRAVLRRVLGNYLGKAGGDLCFRYNAYGKPELMDEVNGDRLKFNLSHSGGWALIAVSRDCDVGIDIEEMKADVDTGVISNRFFSRQELIELNSSPPEHRHEIFYRYWARKEAFVKALGKGVSFPVETCDVTSLNGESFLPVMVSGESSGWYGVDLEPGMGYAAALVISGTERTISCREY